MPKTFTFPDVNDRTPNAPFFLENPNEVLGFYNQENILFQQARITEKVKDWYIDYALRYGWDRAKFLGNQCLLEAKLSLNKGE